MFVKELHFSRFSVLYFSLVIVNEALLEMKCFVLHVLLCNVTMALLRLMLNQVKNWNNGMNC